MALKHMLSYQRIDNNISDLSRKQCMPVVKVLEAVVHAVFNIFIVNAAKREYAIYSGCN